MPLPDPIQKALKALAVADSLRKAAIRALLRERDAFLKDIAAKLARLGYAEDEAPKPGRRRKPQRPRTCRVCGERGHDARTCPKKAGAKRAARKPRAAAKPAQRPPEAAS